MTTALPLRLSLVGIAAALVALAHPLRATTEQRQRDHLDWMLTSLPAAPAFAQGKHWTGKLGAPASAHHP